MDGGEPKAGSKTSGAQESAQKAGEKEFEAESQKDTDPITNTNTQGEGATAKDSTKYKDDEGNFITADETFRRWSSNEYHAVAVGDNGDRFTNPPPPRITNPHWKASEIFSRSSEEDPTDYEYTDPRDTEIGG